MFKLEQIAVDIAKSLNERPEEWSALGLCYLKHKSGLHIWVANEAYRIEVNGNKPSPRSRKHIFKAYQDWLGSRLFAQTPEQHSDKEIEG